METLLWGLLAILLLGLQSYMGSDFAHSIQRKRQILASIAEEPIELKAERTTREKGFTPEKTQCVFGNSTGGADCTVHTAEGATLALHCLSIAITCLVLQEGGSP